MTGPDRPAAGARAVVFGVGATGARIARLLGADPRVGSVEVRDTDSARLHEVLPSLGPTATTGEGPAVPDGTDIVVVATTAGTQAALARIAVEAGAAVVTTTNEIAETRDLLSADGQARQRGVPLLVGAGYMPGLTCLLARLGAAEFDIVDEIHVAKAGTGGPRLRPPASPGPEQPRHRLARRPLEAPGRRLGPGAVLVPRSGGRAGLLPGRPSGRAAARAGLPRRRSGDGPHGGHPPRPPHGPPDDDAPPPSRGPSGRGARGVAGLAGGAGAR